MAMGAKGSMKPYQNWVENMVPTPSFDTVYAKEFESVRGRLEPAGERLVGSTDIGNVSQVVPERSSRRSASATARADQGATARRWLRRHTPERDLIPSCSGEGARIRSPGSDPGAGDLEEDQEEHKYEVEHQAD